MLMPHHRKQYHDMILGDDRHFCCLALALVVSPTGYERLSGFKRSAWSWLWTKRGDHERGNSIMMMMMGTMIRTHFHHHHNHLLPFHVLRALLILTAFFSTPRLPDCSLVVVAVRSMDRRPCITLALPTLMLASQSAHHIYT